MLEVGDPVEHCLRYCLDGLARGIQNPGILCRPQRCYRSLGIPPVTVLYVPRKGGKANINTLVFQLLMPPACTLLRARRQVHLETGLREHVSPHVTPVGHQSRGLAEAPLQGEERIAHGLQCRNRRRTAADLLRPQFVADRLAVEPDQFLAGGVGGEPDVQAPRQFGQCRRIVEADAPLLRRKRQQPVQRSAVQQVPAQGGRNAAGDRALARTAGTVDGNDGDLCRG